VGFYSRWRDAVVVVPSGDSNFPLVTENAGRNDARGVEFLASRHWSHWSVEGNVSYVDSRNLTTDEDYVAFPRWIGNLILGYQWPEHGLKVEWLQRLQADVSEGTLSSTRPAPENLPILARSDIQLTQRLNQDLQFEVHIFNLFDRDNFVPSVWGAENGLPGQPFAVQFGVTASF